MTTVIPEHFWWAGLPTFMRAPYVPFDALATGPEAVVLGIPLDHGASYRDGAKYAPRAIREYSHWDRVDDTAFTSLNTGVVLESTPRHLVDCGDVMVWPTDPERTNAEIERIVGAARRVAPTVILGGDHSITYACFQAHQRYWQDQGCTVGLLHLDAHFDVEQHYSVLPRVWHGNPFRCLIEEDHLRPEHMVTIGPRGVVPTAWVQYAHDKGVRVVTAYEALETGLVTVMRREVERLAELVDKLYVSIDIDVLDPAHAPGTGTPSFGGLPAHDLSVAVHELQAIEVTGVDLVEVSPPLDPTGLTLVAAADILWNLLSFGLRKP